MVAKSKCMIQDILSTLEANSKKAIESFIEKLGTYRTGRASSSLVENLMVDSYGTKMALKSVASIAVPEPKLIILQPWDRSNIPAIEKAILTSNLGLSPQTEDAIIRVIVPPLTGERREELKKLVKQEAEKARVTIRQYRKESMDEVKAKKEAKDLTEDDERKAKDLVQKEIDLQVTKIEELLNRKLADLEQV